MSNPSKAKGTAAETAIVRYLRANGFPYADRQPLRGGRDQGDINVCPGVIIEAKTSKRTGPTGLPSEALLDTWQDQTTLEATNAGTGTIGVLVVKRHGTTDPGRWLAWVQHGEIAPAEYPIPGAVWVMLPLADLVQVLRFEGYGDQLDEVAS